MSQVVQLEAITSLLLEKGIFTKEEFLEMVRAVDREIKRKRDRLGGREYGMKKNWRLATIILATLFLTSIAPFSGSTIEPSGSMDAKFSCKGSFRG